LGFLILLLFKLGSRWTIKEYPYNEHNSYDGDDSDDWDDLYKLYDKHVELQLAHFSVKEYT
jgi:hypothetical protein